MSVSDSAYTSVSARADNGNSIVASDSKVGGAVPGLAVVYRNDVGRGSATVGAHLK